ncbi:MAG: pyrimidine-nucleoside phosphorylase [Anaerolineae bacterium]
MRAVDIIAKKRDGQALTEAEINWFIQAYTQEAIPDYQVAAWLMAVCIHGMTADEVTWLTLAMAHSGEMLDLSSVASYVVDKHSSGGVGDKTSLVVLPLVAACGVPVAKMSGRGLGYSGGTLDKLEAIPGFQVSLSDEQFHKQAREIGLAITGQSRALAPADGKLYALRDVTATVSSIPLIASSIISKKFASGAHGVVLDVKAGSGAFMTNLEDARKLATTMVEIGVKGGRDIIAVISDMNQPLGHAVGNALEVAEAIDVLKGEGPSDLRAHCLEIAAHMLRLAGQGEKWIELDDTRHYLETQITNGAALNKLREVIAAQGGDPRVIDNTEVMPQARITEHIEAERDGYIAQVAADHVALAAFVLGAGREKKEDSIDLAVGVKVYVNVGDEVRKGQRIATIYANDLNKVPESHQQLQQAIAFEDQPVARLPLFYDVIGRD